MGWESSGVVGFDLGPLLQGQTRIAKGRVSEAPLKYGVQRTTCPLKNGVPIIFFGIPCLCLGYETSGTLYLMAHQKGVQLYENWVQVIIFLV